MKKIKYNLRSINYKLLLFIVAVSTFLSVDYGITHEKQISKQLIIDETFLPSISTEDTIYSLKLLNENINDILSAKELQSTNLSVSVYSIDKQRYFFQKEPHLALTPASTTKLITSFLYLVSNYPNYKIRTSVYADSPFPNNGVLTSNMYIYGRGNILLSESDLDTIALSLKTSGIEEIKGDIYADNTFFDEQKNRFKYSGDLDEVQPVADVTPLGMNKNLFIITVKSNPITGQADVIINPRSDAIKIVNNTKVIGSILEEEKGNSQGNKYKFDSQVAQIDFQEYGDTYPSSDLAHYQKNVTDLAVINKKVNRTPFKSPKKTKKKRIVSSGAKVKLTNQGNGIYLVSINGTIGKNYSNSFYYRMENPEVFTAGALKSAIERQGIKVNGDVKLLSRKEKKFYGKSKEIAFVENNAIEMMKLMNKNSDNFIAEQFYKINGTFYKNFSSNNEAVQYLLQHVADSLNLLSLKCIINDGSGLSRRNRITSETLIDILNYTSQMGFVSYFDSTLAVAGVDGTLRKRMIGTKAEANVRAKTGTHRNVSALAGYVNTLDNEKLCFSIISNGNSVYAYKQIEDRIAVALADFKYVNKPDGKSSNIKDSLKKSDWFNIKFEKNSSHEELED